MVTEHDISTVEGRARLKELCETIRTPRLHYGAGAQGVVLHDQLDTLTTALPAALTQIEALEKELEELHVLRDEEYETLTDRFCKASNERDEARKELEEARKALRDVNDLQHRLAIEMGDVPQQPRIEYWTRRMEDAICAALNEPAPPAPQPIADLWGPVTCANCGSTECQGFNCTGEPAPKGEQGHAD